MNLLKAWETLIIKEKKSLNFLEALQEARSNKKIRVRSDPYYYFKFVDSGDRGNSSVIRGNNLE